MVEGATTWGRAAGKGKCAKEHMVAEYEVRPLPPPPIVRRPPRPIFPPPSPPRKAFEPGEDIQAIYHNGVWYPGKIEAILGPNEYRIAWQDGDPNDRNKISEHIR